MRTLNRIKSKLNHSKNEAKNLAYEIEQESKQKAHKISEETLEALHEAQEKIKHYSKALAGKAKTNPLTTTLLVVGVGCLLGAYFSKRDE